MKTIVINKEDRTLLKMMKEREKEKLLPAKSIDAIIKKLK
jgi:hypothetical protein